MSWSPHVTVAAVITDAFGNHLLVEESPDGLAVLNQPAGHLERDETLIDAVIREVREETCRLFSPEGLVGIYQWVAPNDRTYLRFCFHGTVGEPMPGCRLDPDISTTCWVAPEALRRDERRPRSPMVVRCIDDYLAGRHFPLELLHSLPVAP